MYYVGYANSVIAVHVFFINRLNTKKLFIQKGKYVDFFVSFFCEDALTANNATLFMIMGLHFKSTS